jgi:adenylate cyclase
METRQAKILVVDDTPANIKLLVDRLSYHGYVTLTATSGDEALDQVIKERPDLVLLDVVMPGMSGYEVCRRIRENFDTAFLPVVMITALDPAQERIHGIEAGADDFLSKPINQAELLARVRSLIRVKNLHDTVQRQAAQLVEWNKTLEQRVQEQVKQLECMARLKRFLAPQLAEVILASGTEDKLRSHRREVTIVFLDLRGFTAFAETEEPEEVMAVLREFHAEMGDLMLQYEGTLERFTGDGMMIFFNDPLEVPDPEERAVRMAVAMREKAIALHGKWIKRGYELHLGAGIASGYATIGTIGFESRCDYGVVGTVVNLAARLCGEARPGQILVSQRFLNTVEKLVEAEPLGELVFKGFHRSITTFNIVSLRNSVGTP